MAYKLTMFQDIGIGMSDNFNLSEFVGSINNTKANAVSIGDVSTLKNNIRDVIPERKEGETPAGKKLLVYTHRREAPHIAYAENYDADEISQQYNDAQRTLMLIGDISISRNEYSLVVPVEK